MNKKILPIFIIILVVVIGGIVSFDVLKNGEEDISNKEKGPRGEEAADKDKQKEGVASAQIVDYLEDSILDTNFGGEVFADLYRFGRKGDELFLWVYAVEYYEENGELKKGSGWSGPVALSLNDSENVVDHWKPKEGGGYTESIEDKFPASYEEEVLNFQSRHQKEIEKLEEAAEKKAQKRLSVREIDRVLAVGETDTIELESNRTTGYKWHYSMDDKGVVEVVSDEYQQYEHEEEVVGAGGRRIFEIKGAEEGTTTLEFEYSREWESGEPEKRESVRIKVTEKGRAEFELPEDMDLEFIAIREGAVERVENEENYPEGVEKREGGLICSGEWSSEEIGDRGYCARTAQEGAAGKIRHKHTYTTIRDGALVVIDLHWDEPQCGNYSQPPRSHCEEEVENFDPSEVIANIVEI